MAEKKVNGGVVVGLFTEVEPKAEEKPKAEPKKKSAKK